MMPMTLNARKRHRKRLPTKRRLLQSSGGRLLKDENGYYVIDAHAINELLDVNKYIEAWPQFPTEELNASSVQHPSYPKYRWLLNTRRVPAQASASGSAATELDITLPEK